KAQWALRLAIICIPEILRFIRRILLTNTTRFIETMVNMTLPMFLFQRKLRRILDRMWVGERDFSIWIMIPGLIYLSLTGTFTRRWIRFHRVPATSRENFYS